MKKTLEIYTDGACFGNPGKGGWAAVLKYGDNRMEISGGYRLTTNNRMEIMAVIEALRKIKWKDGLQTVIYSDSAYVMNAFNLGWLRNWKNNNWKKGKSEVKNLDLWLILDELTYGKPIKFVHILGHKGIPDNERCDFLSKEQAKRDDLADDTNYIKSLK